MMYQSSKSSISHLSLPLGSTNDQENQRFYTTFSMRKTDCKLDAKQKAKRSIYSIFILCTLILVFKHFNKEDSRYVQNIAIDDREYIDENESTFNSSSSTSIIPTSYSVDSMGWTHTIENTIHKDILEKSIRRESALKERINRLEKEIQRISRLEILERFGEAPYRVEFDVTILRVGGDMKSKFRGTFIVEMAPLDEMPHSVYTFLHMIDNKLWDDTSFIHSSEHIILAMPRSPSGDKHELLENSEGTSLLFQEYSEHFPHVKYTLGFSGRPGGPLFYISTEDNTSDHGPGGQDDHILHEEADPCFGKGM